MFWHSFSSKLLLIFCVFFAFFFAFFLRFFLRFFCVFFAFFFCVFFAFFLRFFLRFFCVFFAFFLRFFCVFFCVFHTSDYPSFSQPLLIALSLMLDQSSLLSFTTFTCSPDKYFLFLQFQLSPYRPLSYF